MKEEHIAEVTELRLENEVLRRKVGGTVPNLKQEIENLKREAATKERDITNRIELLEKRKEELANTHKMEMNQLRVRIDELQRGSMGEAEARILETRSEAEARILET